MTTTINYVMSTKDYEAFKSLSGNRTINKVHVERLKNSFKNKYLLSPILVNQKYEIIDGQHRFNAAKELNLPINYIIIEGYGIKEVQLLNTNSINWKKEDYLSAYCNLGYPEYLKMQKFMKDFPMFSFQSSEMLLTNATNGANRIREKIKGINNGYVKSFQNGELFIENIDLAYENAKKTIMFKEYYKGYNRRSFVRTMISLYAHENYDHEKMISKLKMNPSALTDCVGANQYKVLLEEIYNFKSKNKVTLRF